MMSSNKKMIYLKIFVGVCGLLCMLTTAVQCRDRGLYDGVLTRCRKLVDSKLYEANNPRLQSQPNSNPSTDNTRFKLRKNVNPTDVWFRRRLALFRSELRKVCLGLLKGRPNYTPASPIRPILQQDWSTSIWKWFCKLLWDLLQLPDVITNPDWYNDLYTLYKQFCL